MPPGYASLTIEGVQYTPDDGGAFVVPDEHAARLVHTYGATTERSAPDLEAIAIAAEKAAHAAKVVWDQRAEEAKRARAEFDKSRAAQQSKRGTLSLAGA
jgi:hypothetical protein